MAKTPSLYLITNPTTGLFFAAESLRISALADVAKFRANPAKTKARVSADDVAQCSRLMDPNLVAESDKSLNFFTDFSVIEQSRANG